jgi:hypothetical protein
MLSLHANMSEMNWGILDLNLGRIPNVQKA